MMLLRRISDHLRSQNWTAVALDFAIVVCGVFIGMQVSNWNAARVDRLSEKAIVERLAEDFASIVEVEEANVATVRKAKERSDALIARIETDTLPQSPRILAEFWAPVRAVRPPVPSSPTYDQLVANGEMRLIESDGLRRTLAQFERQRRLHENGFRQIQASSLTLSTEFWRAVDLADIASKANRPTYARALAEAVSDPGFAGAASSLMTQHGNSLQAHRATLETARDVQRELRKLR